MGITVFLRNAEELLEAWEKATKENPLYLHPGEEQAFSKAMRIWGGSIADNGIKITIRDTGVSFKDGPVFSHADSKHYSNRKDWDNHLKQHGCIEVGNEYNNKKQKPRQIEGDFNCRKELTEATQHVLRRH